MRKAGRSRRDHRNVEIPAHQEGSPYLRARGLKGFGEGEASLPSRAFWICDFGPAEDDFGLRQLLTQKRQEFGHARGIPDVDAEAEDSGISHGNGVGDIYDRLLEREFGQFRLPAQIAHVGEEAAGTHGGVAVPRVDGGEEDGRG